MGRGVGSVLAVVLFGAAGALPAAAADDDPFGSDWPEGPGREDVGYFCSACHSLAIVKQQGLSRRRWDKMFDWMVEEQGMPELEGEERELFLDYLTTHFGQPEQAAQ